MKIFYTQVEELPMSEEAIEEKNEIQGYIEKFVSAGTEIKYIVTPLNWSCNPQFHSGVPIHLSAPILLKAVIQAEKDGFDAAILGGT